MLTFHSDVQSKHANLQAAVGSEYKEDQMLQSQVQDIVQPTIHIT